MRDALIVLLLAFVLDLYLGDPVYPLHPVRLIGFLIQKLEKLLETLSLLNRKGGVILLLVVVGITVGVCICLEILASGYDLFLSVFLVYSCISIQDLVKHGKEVIKALEVESLVKARNAVQMMIGRDAEYLDTHGVARAAVESLAENFVDGFLSPLFWYATGTLIAEHLGIYPPFGGVMLIVMYRSVNTLDSMVGYKNERYHEFGWASAKTDDLMNFLPARIAIPVFSISAFICRLNGRKSWSIGWRDRLKHSSPNAGHAEASVAGALQIKLNGPGIYPHGMVNKPWLGDGTDQVTVQHLKQASYLVLTAAFVFTAFSAVLMAII